MIIPNNLKDTISSFLLDNYSIHDVEDKLLFNETRKEFEGDITFVLFPFLKATKTNPQVLGESIGEHLMKNLDYVESFNIVKGFLNLKFQDTFWLEAFRSFDTEENYTFDDSTILVEFSSPNTNKPLHLGHVRNILLGWSTAQILQAAGRKVIKTQIINDRGIAICKSMLAWTLFGNEATPQNIGKKPDHFVGDYYVKFEQEFKNEYESWQISDEANTLFEESEKQDKSVFFKSYKNTYFNEKSALGKQAKSLLLKWEANDPDTRKLWEKMNGWVYEGFEETYKRLKVEFDSYYYESDTYKLGKDIIEGGLASGVFYKKDDGSVWIDLEDAGLDHKLVLRSDGTSVYMTQDIGTAQLRYQDTRADGMVYVVADEQNYHFQALFAIMKKLGESYSDHLHHLSYGMVDLTTGKMKSREGKVVDADDLMNDVISTAKQNAIERGETESISLEEREQIYEKVGLGALKFFILKVNPKKRMVFDPNDSVDMQGTTGPYVQNAYVRVQSINRKAASITIENEKGYNKAEEIEIELIKRLLEYPEKLKKAAEDYDPSIIAMYCYDVAKVYHKFYNDVRILGAEEDSAKAFRVLLGDKTARILRKGFNLLGIEMPERM